MHNRKHTSRHVCTTWATESNSKIHTRAEREKENKKQTNKQTKHMSNMHCASNCVCLPVSVCLHIYVPALWPHRTLYNIHTHVRRECVKKWRIGNTEPLNETKKSREKRTTTSTYPKKELLLVLRLAHKIPHRNSPSKWQSTRTHIHYTHTHIEHYTNTCRCLPDSYPSCSLACLRARSATCVCVFIRDFVQCYIYITLCVRLCGCVCMTLSKRTFYDR